MSKRIIKELTEFGVETRKPHNRDVVRFSKHFRPAYELINKIHRNA